MPPHLKRSAALPGEILIPTFKYEHSQGGVAKLLRYGVMFNDKRYCKFTAECANETFWKIGQHLVKLRNFGALVFGPPFTHILESKDQIWQFIFTAYHKNPH